MKHTKKSSTAATADAQPETLCGIALREGFKIDRIRGKVISMRLSDAEIPPVKAFYAIMKSHSDLMNDTHEDDSKIRKIQKDYRKLRMRVCSDMISAEEAWVRLGRPKKFPAPKWASRWNKAVNKLAAERMAKVF